jgi:hypothetical protein
VGTKPVAKPKRTFNVGSFALTLKPRIRTLFDFTDRYSAFELLAPAHFFFGKFFSHGARATFLLVTFPVGASSLFFLASFYSTGASLLVLVTLFFEQRVVP